ncbi:MAG TPA: glycosyltransferase [Gemmataceae bacterium]|jgi:glycosyltransferase involved in cell wall biosynthesis|nr:glycosyltransferase [Gemmataceae bacterium]
MRILFFSTIFPQPGKPTRGIYCWRLCQALAKTCAVSVISPWPWLERMRHQGLKGSTFAQGRANARDLEIDYPLYYYPPRVLRNTYAWFMARSVRRSMQRALADFRPDCLLSYWVHPDGAVAAQAAHSIGVPAAVIAGGSDILLLPRSKTRRRSIVSALRANDAVIAVGKDLQAKIIDLGMPSKKVHLVYQGVDCDLFFPGDARRARAKLGLPHDGKVLLWVGNLLPVKGIDVLFEACSVLRDRGEKVHLYLVGDGPLRKVLEKDCHSRGLSDLVKFMGSRLPQELGDWYRAADLTVLPSRSEGLPNVLRESLACGTPFVASAVGSIPELVAGSAASRLVRPDDAPALAGAIRDALHASRGNCSHSLPLLSWDESAARLLQILEPLVAQRHANSEIEFAS